MNVLVDTQVCIGCILCAQVCSAVFKMEADKAVAYENPVSGKNQESAQNAAEQCPVQAIMVLKWEKTLV